jgi:hypothetical protein
VNRDIRTLIAVLGPARSRLPDYQDQLGADDTRCDQLAQQILALDAGAISALAVELTNRQRTLLHRCNVRTASQAIALNSQDLCQRGLVLALLALTHDEDPRDVMLSLAPHHVAAASVGASARPTFDWAADRCQPSHTTTIHEFGRRTDVTLANFGWTQSATTGTWIVPTGWNQKSGQPEARPT